MGIYKVLLIPRAFIPQRKSQRSLGPHLPSLTLHLWNFFFWKLKCVTIAFLALMALFPSQTQGQEAREYQLKAAFLYNFAKFTQWPGNAFKDSSAPLVLCVLGEDPFGEAIDLIKGRPIKARKLEVKRVKRVQDLESCHILFVSSSEKKRLAEIMAALTNSSILTVGETDTFIKYGGIIKFIEVKNKVRFEINAEAMKHAELKISSQLLKLAHVVRTE